MNEEETGKAEAGVSGVASGSPRPALDDLSDQQLDVLVAERVMGWHRQPSYNYWMTFPNGGFDLHALIATWKPSTKIDCAMQVAEKIGLFDYRKSADLEVSLVIGKNSSGEWEIRSRYGLPEVRHKSLPRAICLIAIRDTKTGASSAPPGSGGSTVQFPPSPVLNDSGS